jgi:DNA-binding MarR family transcriptional regulator
VLRGLFTEAAGSHGATIADLVRLDDDTTHAALARLERDGLVICERDPSGRRHWRLSVRGIAAVLSRMDDLELLST